MITSESPRHGPLKWFRLYHEALHDPKVQTLPLEQFKAWINLLCMASANTRRGVIPPVKDIAYTLRMSEARARSIVDALVTCGLIDRDGQGELRPHNWEVRQPPTDDINGRVAKWRAGKAKEGKGVKAKKSPEPQSGEDPDVTLHPTLQVTGDVTVGNGRGREELERELERDREESLSNDNDSGGAGEITANGGTYRVISNAHRQAVEYARSNIGEPFAAQLADHGSEARTLVGGDWRYWRAAMDDLVDASERTTIDKPYAWCLRRIQRLTAHGIPTTREVAIPARQPPASIPLSSATPRQPAAFLVEREKTNAAMRAYKPKPPRDATS